VGSCLRYAVVAGWLCSLLGHRRAGAAVVPAVQGHLHGVQGLAGQGMVIALGGTSGWGGVGHNVASRHAAADTAGLAAGRKVKLLEPGSGPLVKPATTRCPEREKGSRRADGQHLTPVADCWPALNQVPLRLLRMSTWRSMM